MNAAAREIAKRRLVWLRDLYATLKANELAMLEQKLVNAIADAEERLGL